jgi:membrane glycosyltransferase
VIAGLIAPVAMLTQSIDVAGILLGRDSGWKTQRRDDGGIPLASIGRGYARHTAFGVVFAVTAYLVSPYLFFWMLPVVIGLALAIPLGAWTARREPGQAFRRLGLLRIPEEHAPPAVLARAAMLYRELRDAPVEPPIIRLLRDPRLIEAHRAMLPPPRRRKDPLEPELVMGLAKLEDAENLGEAIAALTKRELAAALGDRRGLDRLVMLARS